MLARDFMSRNVIMVQPETTIQELAQLLSIHNISGAPVADKQGRVLGIVTQADLLAKAGKTVSDIMTAEVVCIREDTELDEAAQLLTKQNIKRLPVVRDGVIVGVLSRGDIVKAFASSPNPESILSHPESEPEA